MTKNNQLALIVSYYLSRCDRDAYVKLGYSSFSQATKDIGKRLGVKLATVKNMRDEFDPYHDNTRAGWHQRELRGSRLKVMKAFQNTDDETMLEIVKEILFDDSFKNTEEYKDINIIFSEDTKEKITGREAVFIMRGPTGKKAETFFMDDFAKNHAPIGGTLVDRRDNGCGYDFEIKNADGLNFIEVKGLATEGGGVLFTNKEWQTALKHGDRYYLVLVKNISTTPSIKIIQNPASKLIAKKNIYTTIQVSWNVTEKTLSTSST